MGIVDNDSFAFMLCLGLWFFAVFAKVEKRDELCMGLLGAVSFIIVFT